MAPSDWIPSYALYLSETDQKPFISGLGSQQAVVQAAEQFGVKRFIVRRSKWTVMGERPNGQVVYTMLYTNN